jgi:hypothetical protein
MRVHLIGLGVTGSLFARLLEHSGIAFTWHDIEAERVSWKAATGAIYPCGPPGRADYEQWRTWLGGIFAGEDWIELAAYWYNHKRAPHASRLKEEFRSEGGLALSPLPSIHINSQALVAQTRARYVGLRREGEAVEADYLLVAHGFNPRMRFAYWGWSALVELKHGLPGALRPAFYFRDGRFIMAYAYPVPGRAEAHYAGSCFLKQLPERLHSLEMSGKYDKWKAHFERLSKGEVTVRGRLAEPVEGWRPALDNTEAETGVIREGKRLTVPPLGGSGIRRLPSVWRNVFNQL